MASEDCKRSAPSDEAPTMVKTSAQWSYLHDLPPYSFKNMSSASLSTCSDLVTSRTSFNISNSSDELSPRSVYNDADSVTESAPSATPAQTRAPLGASPVDE